MKRMCRWHGIGSALPSTRSSPQLEKRSGGQFDRKASIRASGQELGYRLVDVRSSD